MDPRVELHVPSEVELVCEEIDVAQRLGLWSKVLCPVPFIEYFL